ncbi:poly(A)-specific ribonuclease [Entophlyctis luteolus]|nr:poly(A)-specific ribonuclease [Entophlyctis luteolus]
MLRNRNSFLTVWSVKATAPTDPFLSMVISGENRIAFPAKNSLTRVRTRFGLIGTVLKNLSQHDGPISRSPGYVMLRLSVPAISTSVTTSPANSKVLVCATAAGVLQLRDIRAPAAKLVARIEAHSGMISDLDISNLNMIATCGCSLVGGQMFPDVSVRLWDLRMTGSVNPKPILPGIVCSDPPSFVRFTTATGISDGLIGCQGTNEIVPWTASPYSAPGVRNRQPFEYQLQQSTQTNLDGYMTGIEISSSGDYAAVTSSAGTVSLWTEKAFNSSEFDGLRVNAYEAETDVIDDISEFIHVGDDSPLSTVGVPYYNSPLLSAIWSPSSLMCEVGQPPFRIPKDVLSDVKMSDFIGYARTPSNFPYKRNQSAKSIALMEKARARELDDEPKFRSEQVREGLKGRMGSSRDAGTGSGARDSVCHVMQPILEASIAFANSPIPKPYRKVQIKYSKFGVEDFDFGFYNKTAYSGLETHIKNSYCNPILQMLFYTRPLREIAKFHILNGMTISASPSKTPPRTPSPSQIDDAPYCTKQNCLLCELGFLFRMLEDAKGANCHATNFLHAFGKLPQANALGLFEHEIVALPAAAGGSVAASSGTGVSAGVSGTPAAGIAAAGSLSSMMHGFHRFILETISSESGCIEIRILKNSVNTADTLVQQVMGIPVTNMNVCLGCKNEDVREIIQFVVDVGVKVKGDEKPAASLRSASVSNVQATSSSLAPPTLPPFSHLLEASLQKESSAKAWCTQCSKYQLTSQVKRIRCLPNVVSINLKLAMSPSPSDDSESAFEGMNNWLPLRIALVLSDSQLRVFDLEKGDAFRVDEYEGSADIAVYDLKEGDWVLFNDFSVQPTTAANAKTFAKWKQPTVLQYLRIDADSRIDYEKLQHRNPGEKLFMRNPLVNYRKDVMVTYSPLTEADFPVKPGFLVAIDAEFIALQKEESELRSDGSRSVILPSKLGLARISILRGEDGPLCGVPFIDDYISTSDAIVDYLTEFSGINFGDLDPSTSTRPLVPLKVAYQKLRYLVDAGCVFVGHGLKKDFRTVNIIIPPEQIIDTVDIFFIKERQRKLSLRFLAWSVLNINIQKDAHDSIEDARTALLLYKKYVELQSEGKFQEALDRVYEEGRKVNFKPPVPTHDDI